MPETKKRMHPENLHTFCFSPIKISVLFNMLSVLSFDLFFRMLLASGSVNSVSDLFL